jgi:hypothetical protein
MVAQLPRINITKNSITVTERSKPRNTSDSLSSQFECPPSMVLGAWLCCVAVLCKQSPYYGQLTRPVSPTKRLEDNSASKLIKGPDP